jgi:hypothetical protein
MDGYLRWWSDAAKRWCSVSDTSNASDAAGVLRGPLPVSPVGVSISGTAPTLRSGTITAANVAQQLAPPKSGRVRLAIQNRSSGDLFVRWDGANASTNNNSLQIAPGSYWENPPHWCPASAVSIIGATTGQAFWAEEA